MSELLISAMRILSIMIVSIYAVQSVQWRVQAELSGCSSHPPNARLINYSIAAVST